MNEFSEAELVQLDDYVPEMQSEFALEASGAQSKRKRTSRSRRRKKNTVAFAYDMKLAKIPKKDAGWSNWFGGVFGN